MGQSMLKIDDLNPDGVKIVVNWDNMVIGASVFVPCVNTDKTLKQVKEIFKNKSWTGEFRVRTENEKLGVRVWRTL
jgi:hypothetical protein